MAGLGYISGSVLNSTKHVMEVLLMLEDLLQISTYLEKILKFKVSVSESPNRVVEVHRCWTYLRQTRVRLGQVLYISKDRFIDL